MPYGLNAVSQTSDLYKNKKATSTWGYQPPMAGSSTFGYKSTLSQFNKDYTFGYKPTDFSAIKEEVESYNRGALDRIFDTLSVFNYTMMGAAVNVLDDDENTTALGGVWSGLKAANPFGFGYQEGEKVGTDVLETLGWKPTGTVGGIARFGTGLALDILTDPTTYMTFGLSGLLKGSKGVGQAIKYSDDIVDVARNIDRVKLNRGTKFAEFYPNFEYVNGGWKESKKSFDIGKSNKKAKNIYDWAKESTTKTDDIFNKYKDSIINSDVEKLSRRRVTAQDVLDILETSPEAFADITPEMADELAKRVNKYAGFDFNPKSSALAFDFFSDKKWGFRKEFLSAEKMRELGDRLGTADFAQNVISSVVSHPAYSKLGKNAARQAIARQGFNGLMQLTKELRAEDIFKGHTKKLMKANAEIRKMIYDYTGILDEDQLAEVTKALEDSSQFMRRKKYNSIADIEEIQDIVKIFSDAKDKISRDINEVSKYHAIYLAKREKFQKHFTKLEQYQIEAYKSLYDFKNAEELYHIMKDKVNDIDGVYARYEELLQKENGIDELLKKGIDEKTAEKTSKLEDIANKIITISAKTDDDVAQEWIAKRKLYQEESYHLGDLNTIQHDKETLDELMKFLYTTFGSDKTKVYASQYLSEFEDDIAKLKLSYGVNKFKTLSEELLDGVKKQHKTDGYIKYDGKLLKDFEELNDNTGEFVRVREYAKGRIYTPFTLKQGKLGDMDNATIQYLKDGEIHREYTVRQWLESKSLFELDGNDISLSDVKKKELADRINVVASMKPPKRREEFMNIIKEYVPFMEEYFDNAKVTAKIFTNKSHAKSLINAIFDVSPDDAQRELMKFTQNYDGAVEILNRYDIKLLSKSTDMEVDKLKQFIENTWKIKAISPSYKTMTSAEELIRFHNHNYNQMLRQLIEDESYFLEHFMRNSETYGKDFYKKRLESQFQGSIKKLKEHTLKNSTGDRIITDKNYASKIVNTLLYAPQKDLETMATSQASLNIAKSARDNLTKKKEIAAKITQEQNYLKILDDPKEIRLAENRLKVLRDKLKTVEGRLAVSEQKLMQTIAGRKRHTDEMYRLYLYDNLSKKFVSDYTFKESVMNDVDSLAKRQEISTQITQEQNYLKILKDPKEIKLTEDKIKTLREKLNFYKDIDTYLEAEGGANKIKYSSDDAYANFNNLSEYKNLSAPQRPFEDKAAYMERIKEQYEQWVMIGKQALIDAGGKKDTIQVFAKAISVSEDTAYDILMDLKLLAEEKVFTPPINETLIKDEEFVLTTLIDNFGDKKFSELTDEELLYIDGMLLKANENSGGRLISIRQFPNEAKQLDTIMKYISDAQDIYKKYGLEKEFPEIKAKISDFNKIYSDIESGSYLFTDLKQFGEMLERTNTDYIIKNLDIADYNLYQNWTHKFKATNKSLYDQTFGSAILNNKKLLDNLKSTEAALKKYNIRPDSALMQEKYTIQKQLLTVQKQMNRIMNAVGSNDLSKLRLEDMKQLRHQMDLARVNSIIPSLRTRFSAEFIRNELMQYDSLAEYLDDANLKEIENAIYEKEFKILERAELLDKGRIAMEELRKKYDDMSKNYIMDDFQKAYPRLFNYEFKFNPERLNERIAQLDGIIHELNVTTNTEEINYELIKQFLGKDVLKYGTRSEDLKELIARKFEETVIDKQAFNPDTYLNEKQQEIAIKLNGVLDEVKDLENLNEFIQSYIPHMVKPKYQYQLLMSLDANPMSSLLGLSLEKFNKHSLSRRWNLTIEQYKSLVNHSKAGTYKNDPEVHLMLKEASVKGFIENIRRGKIQITLPKSNETMNIMYDTTHNKFHVLTDSPEKKIAFENYMREFNDKDMIKYEAHRYNLKTMKGLEIFTGKGDYYIKKQLKDELKADAIYTDIIDHITSEGAEFFKKMPDDLFEENPLKLVLYRKLFSNRLIADAEAFPQIKSLICRKAELNEDGTMLKELSDDETYVVAYRELEEFKNSIRSLDKKDPRRASIEAVLSSDAYNVEKAGRNTFMVLNREQADYFHAFVDRDGTLTNVVRKDLLNTYNEVEKKQLNQYFEAFLNVYDKMLTIWKLNVTVVSPAFHIANKAGNAFNSFLDIGFDTFNPEIRKTARNIVRTMGDEGTKGFFKTKDGTSYSYAELLSNALDLGVIDEGMFGSELRDLIAKENVMTSDKLAQFVAKQFNVKLSDVADWQKYNPLNPDTFILYQKGTNVGAKMENIDRLVHWIAGINNGLGMIDSAEHVTKFLFDYSKGTAFEKEVLKRVFPFWSFIRNNTKLQYQMLIEKPHIYRTIAKIRNEFEAQVPDSERLDKKKVASYASDWWQTPFDRETRAGDVDLLLNPNLPFQGLGNNPIAGGLENIIGMINPLLKAPVELTTGKSLYSGKEIYSSKLEYMLSQTYYGSTVSKINSSGVDGKILKLMSAILGIKVGQYNEEKENLLYYNKMIDSEVENRDEVIK